MAILAQHDSTYEVHPMLMMTMRIMKSLSGDVGEDNYHDDDDETDCDDGNYLQDFRK